MKRIMLLIIISIFSITAHAVDLLNGYVVMANNDTVTCKIKGGRFLTSPFQGVTIVDGQGQEQSFNSKDKKIVAFGFVERLRKYDYKLVEVSDRSETGFYQLLVNGKQYKLYSRPTTVYGGNPTYVLFNTANEFVKFEPCLVCPWRKQLKEFFKNDPKALELAENAPRVNIPKFVLDLNKVEQPK